MSSKNTTIADIIKQGLENDAMIRRQLGLSPESNPLGFPSWSTAGFTDMPYNDREQVKE
jgi:hypothetical protein